MTTTTAADTQPYSSATFDWSAYARYRPSYPLSLFTTIYDHHASHGGRFGSVHDAGCGGGIAASFLAARFEHVYLSDPSANAIASAKSNLEKSSYSGTNFSFKQASAEDISWLEPESIDMVTIGAAIHWTYPELAVRAAATVLRTGGTLAIWYYNGRPFFVDNPPAGEIFNEIMERWAEQSKKPGSESEKSLFVSNTELDCVPFPEELFERRARRIKINAQGQPDAFALVRSKAGIKYGSRIGKYDVLESCEVPGSWETIADVEWLQGYVQSLQPTISTESCADLWKQMDVALGGEQKTTRIIWPTVLLLATKK
jgi:trans-aconitate 3-methyltransferase